MKKILYLAFWITPIFVGLFWHPFEQEQKNYIYKLKHFEKNNIHQQYLLLKNNASNPIYNDMNVKGPFESVIKAHQSIEKYQVGSIYGELHYLPIVRKHYAN